MSFIGRTFQQVTVQMPFIPWGYPMFKSIVLSWTIHSWKSYKFSKCQPCFQHKQKFLKLELSPTVGSGVALKKMITTYWAAHLEGHCLFRLFEVVSLASLIAGRQLSAKGQDALNTCIIAEEACLLLLQWEGFPHPKMYLSSHVVKFWPTRFIVQICGSSCVLLYMLS